MEGQNNKSVTESIVTIAVLIFFLGILVGSLGYNMVNKLKAEPQADTGTELAIETELATETELDAASVETDVQEEPEIKDPKIADYFVKTIPGDNMDRLYEEVDEDSIDSLIENYNYFDFCSFAEYLGVKCAFLRSTIDGSVTLTAEQSPIGTPTKIIQNNLQWAMRIIKDENNEVKDLTDDYEDYIDIRTTLDNDSNLTTCVYVCHGDKCVRSVYKGKATPKDIFINVNKDNMSDNCDTEPAVNFIMNAEALKSFLKMTEEDILWNDNPFEEIGDEWTSVENYKLFRTEG